MQGVDFHGTEALKRGCLLGRGACAHGALCSEGPAGRTLGRHCHLEALQNFEQGVPHCHFALGSTDYGAGPALNLCSFCHCAHMSVPDIFTLPDLCCLKIGCPRPHHTWPLLPNALASTW